MHSSPPHPFRDLRLGIDVFEEVKKQRRHCGEPRTSKTTAMLAVLWVSALTLAQEWSHSVTKDDFLETESWMASVGYHASAGTISLFAACETDGSMAVGLMGSGVRGSVHRQEHDLPVRFDDKKAHTRYFIQSGQVMSMTVSPVVRNATVERRSIQICVKQLSDHSRFRVRLPSSSEVLEFPLVGAKDNFVTIFRACGTKASAGTIAFLDADEQPYDTFVAMLLDDTWRDRQESHQALTPKERRRMEKVFRRRRR